MDIKASIKRVLADEIEGIQQCHSHIDENVENAVTAIFSLKGKLVISGMGKSGLIAQKIAATFSSTGTPAFFIHPTEAGHGDLGMIQDDDLFFLLSFNGQQREFDYFYNISSEKKIPIIAITGKKDSALFKNASIPILLNISKESEILPYAPSVSSTVTLAMGDAIALTVAKMRNFEQKDFAKLHPGGALGQLLGVTISAVMHKGTDIPIVEAAAEMTNILYTISSFRMGAALVCSKEGDLLGIITDGDIRRMFEEHSKEAFDLKAEEIMNPAPTSVAPELFGKDALEIMEDRKITVLPVVDKGKICGIIHMHNILGGNN